MPARYPGISRVSRSSMSCANEKTEQDRWTGGKYRYPSVEKLFNSSWKTWSRIESQRVNYYPRAQNRTTASKLTRNFFESEISHGWRHGDRQIVTFLGERVAFEWTAENSPPIGGLWYHRARVSQVAFMCVVHVCTEGGSCGPPESMKGNEEPVTGRSHVGFYAMPGFEYL